MTAEARVPPPSSHLLLLKIWRDTLSLIRASFSLIILVGIGVTLFVLFSQARLNLDASYTRFYARTHFTDASVLVQSAPEVLVDSARLIPGVTAAVGRRVKDGTIVLRDRPRRRVMGRFVGLQQGESPVNAVMVVRGRRLTNRGECLLEQSFARSNDLPPGSVITGSYLGQRRDFLVVGHAASPEYLYPVPDKESPMAMPGTFGVVWIDDDALRQWLGLGKVVTQVDTLTVPGMEKQVETALRALGDRYGLRSSWTQADQPSNRLLQLDLQGYIALSAIFPGLFLFAAGLSLYSSLSRIVRLQTGIVGFLRASGLSQRAVLWHYIVEGGLLSSFGALPGLVAGHLLAGWMVGLYVRQLMLPIAYTDPHLRVMATGVTIALVVGVLASWLPARAAAATAPAVAMRGDMSLADQVPADNWLMALTRMLPTLLRIPARGLLRRPSRTLFAIGGLSSGMAILLMTLGLYVSITDAISDYLDRTVQYEIDVWFSSPHGETLAEAVSSAAGVTAFSRTCAASVRLVSGSGQINLLAYGVEAGQTVMGLRSVDGERPRIAPDELWMARHTARRLGVEPGDPIMAEWAFSSRQRRVRAYFRVAGLLDISFGGFAIGEYHDVRRKLVDRVYPEATYGALIQCSPEVGRTLRRRLEREDIVTVVNTTAEIREQINTSMRVTFIFISVLLAFGAVLAGAVLHSVSTVGILERMRELATLRSLGFSARATTAIAAVEVYLMAAVGLVIGTPIGIQLNRGFIGSFETETFTYRTNMPLWAWSLAAGMIVALVSFSLRTGVNRLRTMDLAQATKARE